MKIKEAIKDYLVDLEIKRYSPNTIVSYRNKLNTFNRFCNEQDVVDIEDVSMIIVKQFIQHMLQREMSGIYINNLLKTIKTFIQYSFEEGYGGFNTKKGFKWVKEDKTTIKALTRRDIKRLIANCKGNTYRDIRDMCMIVMMLETGIRCSELIGIKPEDIYNDYILIRGKGRKERVVPITSHLTKAMLRYHRVRENYFFEKPATDDNYFLSFRGNKLTPVSVERIVKQRGEGIEGVRLSPHTLRHSWAQEMLKQNVDVYYISRLCGHSNIKITQTYLESLKDEDVIHKAKQHSVLMNI